MKALSLAVNVSLFCLYTSTFAFQPVYTRMGRWFLTPSGLLLSFQDWRSEGMSRFCVTLHSVACVGPPVVPPLVSRAHFCIRALAEMFRWGLPAHLAGPLHCWQVAESPGPAPALPSTASCSGSHFAWDTY